VTTTDVLRARRDEILRIAARHGAHDVRVWSTATRDLPAVRSAIAVILPPLDQLERELAGETGDDVTDA
jgi:hypothetical protein